VQILEDFEAGKINALCNVAVLTEGWDAPRTDCIGLLRPTKSLGLYVQICGRGMRPWENKKDCLLLDYGENMKRHGCIDVATPERNKTGEELDENDGIWICDCLAVNDSLYRECIECGQPKPKRIEPELLEPVAQEKEAAETTIAAEGNVLSDMADEKFKPVEKQVKVTRIWAEQSISKNNNRYLKINFKSPEQYWPYSHSMMIEMRGKPRQVAERQWMKMSRGLSTLPYAVSTAERIVNEDKIFSEVKEIRIRKEGKYWNVINVYF
jgi:DNA repair protein RadD